MRAFHQTFLLFIIVSSAQASSLFRRHGEKPSTSESQAQNAVQSNNGQSTVNGTGSSQAQSTDHAGDSNDPQPVTKACSVYYSANTGHAVCEGDPSVMCLAGCTGGVVAQNCQMNATSVPSTETCNVAFSKTSATAYLCTTTQGAYTCTGPSSGEATCNGCVPCAPDASSTGSTHIGSHNYTGDRHASSGSATMADHSPSGSMPAHQSSGSAMPSDSTQTGTTSADASTDPEAQSTTTNSSVDSHMDMGSSATSTTARALPQSAIISSVTCVFIGVLSIVV